MMIASAGTSDTNVTTSSAKRNDSVLRTKSLGRDCRFQRGSTQESDVPARRFCEVSDMCRRGGYSSLMPDTGRFHTFLPRLQSALSRELPGLDAQRLMAPSGRLGPGYDPNPGHARQSAVLLVLMPDARNEVSLLYIERATSTGPHSGQIAFPGGMAEDDDTDLIDTSLRECREETGVVLSRSSVLGTLSRLYIDVSQFSVLPVVAWTEHPVEFRPEPSEVARAFLVPLQELRESVDRRRLDRRGSLIDVPCYAPSDTMIWGATAMITAEFLALVP